MATLYQADKIPLSTATSAGTVLLWTSPALVANQLLIVRARLHATLGSNTDCGYAEMVTGLACNGAGAVGGLMTSTLAAMNGTAALMTGASLTGLTLNAAISGNSLTLSGANTKAASLFYWLTGEFDIFVGV